MWGCDPFNMAQRTLSSVHLKLAFRTHSPTASDFAGLQHWTFFTCRAPSHPPLSHWRAGRLSSRALPEGKAVLFQPQTLLSLFSLGYTRGHTHTHTLAVVVKWGLYKHTNKPSHRHTQTHGARYLRVFKNMQHELAHNHWFLGSYADVCIPTYPVRRISSLIKASLIVL